MIGRFCLLPGPAHDRLCSVFPLNVMVSAQGKHFTGSARGPADNRLLKAERHYFR